jgi:branched-chain amino acid transport system ATP-binding protein
MTGPPLLEVEGLSRSFGGLQAVKNLTFAVREGEILALIGPNGAGKTTVFGLLSGFLAPDAGDVRLRGRSLVGLPPHRICALGLARTFQIVRPFPRLTVLRNVTVGALTRHPTPAAAERRAQAVLDEVGLGAKRDQPAGGLTLAERKRLELARALATEPTVLLLDEVMAGLTATETERIVELVRAINRRGVTVVLIEHVMRAVMSLSSRIVVINYGERIAEGVPEAVANDPRVIEAYLGESEGGADAAAAPR